MLVAISAVSASLLGAVIGAAAGLIGGLGGQALASRLDRRTRRADRQPDDLIALQDVVARLNRSHHRVSGFWSRGERVAYDLWEDFVSLKGEALALNERVVDNVLRGIVEGLRENYSVQWRPEVAQRERERIDVAYMRAQQALGQEVRTRLK